jgi:hypothetical protein
MNYRLLFLCASLIVCSVQAMEKQEERYKRQVIATYLKECGRDIKKEGLCESVSGDGITISAEKKALITKLTVTAKKISDSSNDPEFNTGAESSKQYSFAALRRSMKRGEHADDRTHRRILCKSKYYSYVETRGRSQTARDEECKLYTPSKKLFRLNEEITKERNKWRGSIDYASQ